MSKARGALLKVCNNADSASAVSEIAKALTYSQAVPK